MQRYNADSRASARVGRDVREWFPVQCWIEARLCDVSLVVNSYMGGVVSDLMFGCTN